MIRSWTNLKEKLALYYYKKEQKKQPWPHQFVNIGDVNNVLVLFDATNGINETYIDLIDELELKKKRLDVLCYYGKKENEKNGASKKNPRFNYFSRKDINWLKVPHPTLIKKVNAKKYDLLLVLDLNPQYPLLYLSGVSNALCRVGKYHIGSVPYLDLLINTTEKDGIRGYITQLKHFLSIIKTQA